MIESFTGRYFFLSNFYPNNQNSLEHKYQAAKTNNPEKKAKIREADKPGKAKRLGNLVTLRYDWEGVKVLIMWTLLEEKFKNPNLRASLLATGDKKLVEGNLHHDNFWGNCHCNRIQCIATPGWNILGKALMSLRKKLRG